MLEARGVVFAASDIVHDFAGVKVEEAAELVE